MSAPSTGDDYRECSPTPDHERCTTHGGRYLPLEDGCITLAVLDEIRAERARQFAKYGTNEDLQDGTGENWLEPLVAIGVDAAHIESVLRFDYEVYEKTRGTITWMHLVREEVAEAFAEMDPTRLREEVLQVAALCVSWIEKIDAREERI